MAGIIFSLLFVPLISDKYGRKNVFCGSILLSIMAQFGLIVSENYQITLILIAVFGMAWPGISLVGLIYGLELFPKHLQKVFLWQFIQMNIVSIFLLPLVYKSLVKDWYPVQSCALLAALASLCFSILFMPESLWTYYSKGNY